ncbi:MAG: pantetheine-phosphate adenylyltransferase [Anaerotruncus sp.]|nr:pantetheine-phosphate adenylyltransferase [Anaerotruncus sp.]
MERIVICPGSFDPITKGHEEIIRRAASLFDRVIVVVSANPEKNPRFSIEERAELIRRVCAQLPNVEVDQFSGLLVDYVAKSGASAIVKGLRAVSDFDYEFQMALTNKKLMPQAETIFLTSSSDSMYLSSSIVRQIAQFGGDISPFVPACILDTVKQRICTHCEE